MKDEVRSLRIQLAAKGCNPSAAEIAKMEEDLHTLRKLVQDFPVSTLYITIVHHKRTDDYHVKTSLVLPGRTVFTGDRDRLAHPAYERCVRKLVKKVEAYKQRMHGEAELAKQAAGTHHIMAATQEVDIEQLREAVAANDYVAFRRGVDVFEEPLRQCVGRWIQRYPDLEAQLGDMVTVSDIVEEVFLNAFEQFSQHPEEVLPGEWLAGLIDPSVQALLQAPDDEFASISFARSLLEG
jgi:hypothetical protein